MSSKPNPSLPRIYADFNNADKLGRLRLNCDGTKADLQRLGIALAEGMQLMFYMEDIECCGMVTFSSTENLWVGLIDWSKIRDMKA